MPLIKVKLIENVFTAEQKKELLAKFTDAIVSLNGQNMRPLTWVIIEEERTSKWDTAGDPDASVVISAGDFVEGGLIA